MADKKLKEIIMLMSPSGKTESASTVAKKESLEASGFKVLLRNKELLVNDQGKAREVTFVHEKKKYTGLGYKPYKAPPSK